MNPERNRLSTAESPDNLHEATSVGQEYIKNAHNGAQELIFGRVKVVRHLKTLKFPYKVLEGWNVSAQTASRHTHTVAGKHVDPLRIDHAFEITN